MDPDDLLQEVILTCTCMTGPPIHFRHEGLPYAGVTRPATKADSFLVYKGIKEVRAVENPTTTPSDFLRVEFKTQPLEKASLRGGSSATSPRRWPRCSGRGRPSAVRGPEARWPWHRGDSGPADGHREDRLVGARSGRKRPAGGRRR